MRRLRESARAIGVVLAAVLALLLTGCGPTFTDLPLPSGGVSGETITVTADFDEALNLAQGALVKVNGVDSGRVTSVTAKDFRARVVFVVQKAAGLREGATARLRYTTPLGELFIDVTNPTSGAALADGATLTRDDTSTAPSVEDALAQASLLVNGGGLAQLQTITDELDKAIGGREGRIRELLGRTDTFLTQANATTAEFDRALTSLAATSQLLQERQTTIDAALRDVRPAARVLRRLTPDLTELLRQLDRFAGLANQTVLATRDNILATLRSAEPVLREAAATGPRWRQSLESLVSLSKVLQEVVPGDYLNLGVLLHVDKLADLGLGRISGAATGRSAP
ncbi:MCE family protein [Nocardioides fonticola]|uniref:MCE family protein n=1 Tax=Nocardioides fonticola TaxID=450363 RepID=A0ABP7XZC2_9ACTN